MISLPPPLQRQKIKGCFLTQMQPFVVSNRNHIHLFGLRCKTARFHLQKHPYSQLILDNSLLPIRARYMRLEQWGVDKQKRQEGQIPLSYFCLDSGVNCPEVGAYVWGFPNMPYQK